MVRFLLVSLVAVWCAAAAIPYSSELIFPLESWHNHSSSVVELPNGDLLVVWFHGSGERTADDVLIRGARWNHTTGKWSEPFLMADTPGFPETNPVLFLDSRRRLMFFWPLIVAHRWETALMKYRISTDYQQESGPPRWEFQDNIVLIPRNIEARTKEYASAAAAGSGPMAERARKLMEHAGDEYFSRMGWFTRTHPLQLPSGRILVPMYSDGFSFGIMAISDDGGSTWSASEPIVGAGCVQPSVVRRNDGTLVAYLRDNGPPPKRAMISFSKDDGVTWTPAHDTEIPNPGTSIEVVRMRDGDWIAVYNDLEQGRYSLVAAVSDDEGATWKWRRHLDGRPDQPGAVQYHYPSVIQAKDGAIHVTYSYFVKQGKSIKHARFAEEWVKAGE
ncbi:MAG TPA: sialidase family protein [Candidatus Sulfopaludibacter sp.]|nr:sialidase family protein [Candidatus Sulfopaludibacter sp.]